MTSKNISLPPGLDISKSNINKSNFRPSSDLSFGISGKSPNLFLPPGLNINKENIKKDNQQKFPKKLDQIRRVRNYNWKSKVWIRAGVIPRTKKDGKFFYAFSIEDGAADIADFGGGREKKDYDALDTAIREYLEESLGIFGIITRSYLVGNNFRVLENEGILEIIVDVEPYLETYVNRFYDLIRNDKNHEAQGIVWLTKAQILYIIDHQYARLTNFLPFHMFTKLVKLLRVNRLYFEDPNDDIFSLSIYPQNLKLDPQTLQNSPIIVPLLNPPQKSSLDFPLNSNLDLEFDYYYFYSNNQINQDDGENIKFNSIDSVIIVSIDDILLALESEKEISIFQVKDKIFILTETSDQQGDDEENFGKPKTQIRFFYLQEDRNQIINQIAYNDKIIKIVTNQFFTECQNCLDINLFLYKPILEKLSSQFYYWYSNIGNNFTDYNIMNLLLLSLRTYRIGQKIIDSEPRKKNNFNVNRDCFLQNASFINNLLSNNQPAIQRSSNKSSRSPKNRFQKGDNPSGQTFIKIQEARNQFRFHCREASSTPIIAILNSGLYSKNKGQYYLA